MAADRPRNSQPHCRDPSSPPDNTGGLRPPEPFRIISVNSGSQKVGLLKIPWTFIWVNVNDKDCFPDSSISISQISKSLCREVSHFSSPSVCGLSSHQSMPQTPARFSFRAGGGGWQQTTVIPVSISVPAERALLGKCLSFGPTASWPKWRYLRSISRNKL